MSLVARAKKFLGLRLSSTEEYQIRQDSQQKMDNIAKTIGQLRQNSADAHEYIQPKKQTIRARVVEFIKSRGAYGATTEEVLQAFPQIKLQSLAPRVTELHQDGITVSSGVRQTSAGLNAAVWVINPEAFV